MFRYKSESEPRHGVNADKFLAEVFWITSRKKTVRNWKGQVKSSLQQSRGGEASARSWSQAREEGSLSEATLRKPHQPRAIAQVYREGREGVRA